MFLGGVENIYNISRPHSLKQLKGLNRSIGSNLLIYHRDNHVHNQVPEYIVSSLELKDRQT